MFGDGSHNPANGHGFLIQNHGVDTEMTRGEASAPGRDWRQHCKTLPIKTDLAILMLNLLCQDIPQELSAKLLHFRSCASWPIEPSRRLFEYEGQVLVRN